MNCADMILDSVDVANLDEVNLSVMVESGVNIPEFTCLIKKSFDHVILVSAQVLSVLTFGLLDFGLRTWA